MLIQRKWLSIVAAFMLGFSILATSPMACLAQQAIMEKNATLVYEQGLVQTTEYGKVQGLKEDETLIWRGIPYAKPPVGSLRWKAPQNPEAWNGVLNATQNAKEAVQAKIMVPGTVGSEDCLNLDVYRPDTKQTGLPVLVYIHGGNNQTGSNTEINPNKLAVKANCVVISINYRLDLLGFNPLPALKTGKPLEDSGNYALLDMAKSLDWIKENAKAFGGNPDNITVSGFSAGGRDVMAMLISPVFKGKFQKAISFSGGMTVSDPAASIKVIAKALAKLVVEDKVKENEAEANEWIQQNTDEVRAYLYNLPAERVVRVMGNAAIRMSGFPHLYTDGVVLPKDGFVTKKYNSVPLIMLTGSTEFSFFATYSPYFMPAQQQKTLLSDPKIHSEAQFAIKYGSLLYGLFNTEESAATMFGKYKAPIYNCKFTWGTDESIVGKYMAELVGAHHGIFLPFLTDENIGTRKMFPGAYANDGVKDLTDKFQTYIAQFLWSGNPNGNGLETWEKWSNANNGPTQLVFDADKDKAIIKMSHERISYREVLKEIETDQTITPEAKDKIIKEVLNGRWFSGQLDQQFANPSLWIQ